MLLGIVKEFEAAQSRLGVDPYAAWSAAVQQLRSDWEQGTCVGVERLRDYLERIADDQRYEAMQDLIAEHLQLAWRAGQGTTLEPYLSAFGQDFSELASSDTVPAELIEDEFLARFVPTHGDTPSIDEYQRRFPSRHDVLRQLQRRHLEGGRYVKLQELGRGAMGEVFEAYDHHLSRFVAIKLPKPGVADVPDLLHRFAEEARITAGLEHSAIVTVHEHYHGQATPFYVMRLAAGVPLTQHIREFHHPPLDRPRSEQQLREHQLLQCFATICEALAYAHAHGVLHRDLKPDNIIVGEFGDMAILDWGLAKRLPAAGDVKQSEVDSIHTVVGTPQYMPPEQADGNSDARSDVFGLGAILYEILTACSPHAWPEGFRPADWLQMVRDAKFPRPRSARPQVPRGLEAVCVKALARDPKERYASAAELAQDVRRHLAGQPVAALTNSASRWPWQRWVSGRQNKDRQHG